MKLTKEGRERFQAAVADQIMAAMLKDQSMIDEAIVEGRIGLQEMEDEDLVEYAWDCWQMEPDPEDII